MTKKKKNNKVLVEVILFVTLACAMLFTCFSTQQNCFAYSEEDYYTITFKADKTSTDYKVLKGDSVDFSGVTKTVTYNEQQYKIIGWTTEEVLYPWSPDYVKGYKYKCLPADYVPTEDITLNAVIEETATVDLGGIVEKTANTWFDKIVEWFSKTEMGQQLVRLGYIILWVLVALLCLVALLVISWFVSTCVKMFRRD